jgi:hypothetical protein
MVMLLTTREDRPCWSPEAEVDRQARTLLAQHGSGAVYIALDRLNESIDRCDRGGRDFWAQVIRAIHEHQRSARPC